MEGVSSEIKTTGKETQGSFSVDNDLSLEWWVSPTPLRQGSENKAQNRVVENVRAGGLGGVLGLSYGYLNTGCRSINIGYDWTPIDAEAVRMRESARNCAEMLTQDCIRKERKWWKWRWRWKIVFDSENLRSFLSHNVLSLYEYHLNYVVFWVWFFVVV